MTRQEATIEELKAHVKRLEDVVALYLARFNSTPAQRFVTEEGLWASMNTWLAGLPRDETGLALGTPWIDDNGILHVKI